MSYDPPVKSIQVNLQQNGIIRYNDFIISRLFKGISYESIDTNLFSDKDARIKELEEKLAEVTTWTDANLLTYKDDTTYLVQVYWINSSSVTVEEMYFCTVAQGWKYSRDSSSPDEPCMITHWLPLPASDEEKE